MILTIVPRGLAAATLLAAGLAACAPAVQTGAPAPTAATTTLLTRLGADTVSVEQYTRTATGMTGVLATRAPFAVLSRYAVQLGPDGAPRSAEFSVRRGDGTQIANAMPSISVRYGMDTVTITGHRASGDTTRAIAAHGWLLPFANDGYGLFELAFARLVATGRDSATFAAVPLGFGVRGTTSFPMRQRGPGSVTVSWFGDPFDARHDGRGGILGMDGARTTDKVRVDRVATADVEAIARAWSARDATLGAIGAPSTRDTTRATIGAAHLWVDYGRPALRGRNVWANGVLGDTLWRTGANAATQLSTDTDLFIGGQHVPAGTYSLFTWAGANGYHLIVNRQAGQWGTDYDPRRDLVRVPLRVTDGAPSVERFTITLEPQGADAASLVLAWGTRRLSVPVSTR